MTAIHFNQSTLTIEYIQQTLTGTLPGIRGQEKMAPAPTADQKNRWQVPEQCRDAAVLLLLYPRHSQVLISELHLVLTRRPNYPGVHSGQISFPGGRHEAGETLEATALRETWEEVGVQPKSLNVIGTLSRLYTPPSNFCIYPFVAFSNHRPEFELDQREVAELIEVPLRHFFDPAIYKQETWHFEKYGERLVPFFDVFGHKVWGATAMILSEFITLLKSGMQA